MKDFKFLKFLDRFSTLFDKFGVDYKAMRKILQIKLIMDGRRVPTVFSNSNKKKDESSSNEFIKSLGIYLLMGLILIPFVIMKTNYIYQMSFVFAIIIFFVMTSLISDFSSVLLDIKDKSIVGTKPVNLKTLRFAKTIHVSIYMFYITAALVGPALLVSLYRQGVIFFLIFLFLIILMDMLIIVLTSLIYFLVLRFFDGEKLKDIINYIQIALTMVLAIGYQLLGRLFSIVNLQIQFAPKWWQYFIIPIWFSAPFQMVKKSEINTTFIIFTMMAILIPILAMVIYIRSMLAFEKNLQKLNNNSVNGKRKNKKQREFLSHLLCRNKEERVFFRFASDMMKNEREFKLKVYPSLGFSIIFPFIFIFQQIGFSSFKEVAEGRSYFYIYFCGMMLPTVMMMIKYSERYKGAWIYKTLPINSFVPVFKGAIKAYIAKLFLPLFLVDTIVFVLIFGLRILPDMVIVLLNTMIFNILCFAANKKTLPFSEAFGSTKENGILNLMLALGLAVLAGIHFLSTNINYGVYVYIVLATITNLILWKYAFKISPDKINKN